MKRIKLTQNKYALVDDEDYEQINQYKWQIHYVGRNCYARGNLQKVNREWKKQYMHRLIMNCPEELQIDHINHNGIDNRKRNLRICTQSQNNRSQRSWQKKTSSKYKGVCWNNYSGKWKTQIRLNNKEIHIGYYANEINAALAYDKKAEELFGKFAYLNFKGGSKCLEGEIG